METSTHFQVELIDDIAAMVARKQARDSEEPLRSRIRKALSLLPDFNTHDQNTFLWNEYHIGIGTRAAVAAEAQLLKWLRALEIAAAPEVAAILPLDAEHSLLVRRYWACPGERLRPALATRGPFHEAAQRRFRRDMKKLVAHGKVHPYARGLAHMFVSESSGTLLLNAWDLLRPAAPCEQEDCVESFDFQLSTHL